MSISTNKRYENEYVNRMISKGYHCERVAGSGSGQNAVCDCILFKDGEVFLVEVKAIKEPKLYLRAKIKKQLDIMTSVARKSKVRALLAIKFKYRGWEERVLV